VPKVCKKIKNTKQKVFLLVLLNIKQQRFCLRVRTLLSAEGRLLFVLLVRLVRQALAKLVDEFAILKFLKFISPPHKSAFRHAQPTPALPERSCFSGRRR
jgi:hypothetical protein